MGDFETTTYLDENNRTRVWLWALTPISIEDKGFKYGTSIESFFKFLNKFNSVIVEMHNLKFDGRFIVDYLLNNGYKVTERPAPKVGEFTTLISDLGAWYTVTVKTHENTRIEFRDSLKKIPLAVSQMPEAFGIEEVKGEIDYHKIRPVGYKPTQEEIDYIRNDIRIPAVARAIQIEAGTTKLTVGADALDFYKNMIGKEFFTAIFPVLDAHRDSEIRQAYKGGFTYADPRFTKRRVGSGITYDVNSLYPSVMYNNILPYGEPEYVQGMPVSDERYPLFIVTIEFTAKIKPNHIPCIQIKNSSRFHDTEYLSEVKEPTRVTITNIDLELWQEHYDLEIWAALGGYRFKGKVGLFKDYVDHWMKIKTSGSDGMRTIAKLFLNSLYGKFATNPDVTGRIPVLQDGIVRLVRGTETIREPIYTAMGVFITAYARDKTIRAAQQHYDVFAYADTDSLHLLIDEDSEMLDIDPKRLGAWKREYRFRDAIFVRAKQYIEQREDGTYVPAFAGMPKQVQKQLTFEMVESGNVVVAKDQQKAVAGGVVLTPTTFTVNME